MNLDLAAAEVTDTFNYKQTFPWYGGTDAEDLLYKIGMTIIVQIEINGNATSRKLERSEAEV